MGWVARGGRLFLGIAAIVGGSVFALGGSGGVAAAATPSPSDPPGYWLAASDGGVYQFGTTNYGGMRGVRLNRPIVGATATANGLGYWLVASDGGIFSFGEAGFHGSTGGIRLNKPIVGMAADPLTGGYWLVASDGGVFSFDAPFYGSTGGIRLNKPVVGMAVTPDGRGYWLVASDGGIFSFGDAHFHGSTGGIRLNKPVVGMALDRLTGGYWLVASDGGVFSFDAPFEGSTGGIHIFKPIVGMGSTSDNGYWLAASDGGIFAFGSAPFLGSTGGDPGPAPIVAIAATANGYPFQPGATGYDVSQFSCGHLPPRRNFGIAQVTAGAITSGPNPCYREEAQWAGLNMTAYIFLDQYNGTPRPGPEACSTLGCLSYNFGWFWARYWIQVSRDMGVNPSLWWLDVETGGSWSGNLDANADVVRGAVAGVNSMGGQPGIYSTSYQWPRIVGPLNFPGIPLWVPGAAAENTGPYSAVSFCTSPAQLFADGVVTVVQYGYAPVQPSPYYDPDYACR